MATAYVNIYTLLTLYIYLHKYSKNIHNNHIVCIN